jgi:DNA-3-methyladenine glycosylase I
MTDKRCDWCHGSDIYENYHDTEWGIPCHDDQRLFEFLILEGAQAGLSWITILKRREGYLQAFDLFNPEKIALYSSTKVETLMLDSRIIRNRRKIESAIKNAKSFLALQQQHGSFANYIWQFVNHKPIQNHFESMSDVPATTPESEAMSKALKKLGFSFVGPTICYAYMQSMGMVNDHLITCPRHTPCTQLSIGTQTQTLRSVGKGMPIK